MERTSIGVCLFRPSSCTPIQCNWIDRHVSRIIPKSILGRKDPGKVKKSFSFPACRQESLRSEMVHVPYEAAIRVRFVEPFQVEIVHKDISCGLGVVTEF